MRDEADVTKRLGAFAASASFSNRTNEAILDNFPSQPLKPSEEITFDSSRKWSAIVGSESAARGPVRARRAGGAARPSS